MNGVHELHGTAQLLGGVGNVAFHGALEQVGTDKVLLQQADLLEESVQLTGSNLLLDLSGLAGHLGIVVHEGHLHGHLMVNVSLGNQGLVPVLSAHGSNLHSHVLADFGGVDAALHGQVNQNAMGAAGVDVSHGGVVGKPGEPADLHILTDGHNLLLHDLGDSQVGIGVLASLQSFHVSGSVGGNHGSQVLHQVHESVGLGSEVGLGVHLDDHAHTVDDSGVSHALSGNPVSLLGSLGQALLPEPVHSLVHVAVGGSQSLLAVHHAHVGHFTELLNILSGKSHNFKSSCFLLWEPVSGLPSYTIEITRQLPESREPQRPPRSREHRCPDGPRWQRWPW